MKTKLNFLMLLVLLAALLGGTASPAQAGKPPSCYTGSPGITMLDTSGPTFKFCTTIDGAVYTVRMIRTYELTYSDRAGAYVMAKGTAVNFKSLAWLYSAPVWVSAQELTFEMTTYEGSWRELVFRFHIYQDGGAKFDITLLDYQWQSPDPGAKLAVQYEAKKNGTSLGVQTITYDHFEGDLYHDPPLIP